ncbi:MAG: YeeE/YedE thiosulfate transporter family protein [Peptostreptococcaceae bacterium]
MSEKIEKVKQRRLNQSYKKKKSQIPTAIIVTVISLIIYLYLLYKNRYHSIFWIIGILTGFVLQKSRLCFSASFRDPSLIGSTKILRAIIIGLIITSLGFIVIQYNYIMDNLNINNLIIPGSIEPVGIHTIIGGVMFGIGMVIAGGCATGTLMRIGEGFCMQIIVAIGFIIGSLLATFNYDFWNDNFISKSECVYFPNYVGFELAVTIQILVLIMIYYIAYKFDKKHNKMIT